MSSPSTATPNFPLIYFWKTDLVSKNPLHSPAELPSFHPTNSPQLDELLTTFRTDIFLPACLPKAQQDIIFRKKLHHLLLTDEPATASIGKEVVELRPLHRANEPRTISSLAKILDLLPQAGENAWENLPAFLAGLKISKRKLKGYQMEKIVRRACKQGKEGLIMQCMKQVERTGLSLWDAGAAREMMLASVRRANEARWTKNGVAGALKFAEAVWSLMQDPRHALPKKRDGLVDPMSRPEIVGILLQLHSANALHQLPDPPSSKQISAVRSYATMLLVQLSLLDPSELSLTPPHTPPVISSTPISSPPPPSSYPPIVSKEIFNAANEKAHLYSPLAHGMRLALQLLTTLTSSPENVNLSTQLRQRSTQLDNLLEECKLILEKKVEELGHDEKGVNKEFKGLKGLKILDVNVHLKQKTEGGEGL